MTGYWKWVWKHISSNEVEFITGVLLLFLSLSHLIVFMVTENSVDGTTAFLLFIVGSLLTSHGYYREFGG